MNLDVREVVYEDGLAVVQRPYPVAAADEALIRLRLAGICNTDLELMRGYRNFRGTLGHEFVGEVIEGPREWLGRRVVGEINITCGECDMCRRSMPTQCRNRRTLGIHDYNGAFADVFRLPVQNLHAVPETVSDEEAVFVEPLAAACQMLEAVHVLPTDLVVLIGAGKLGLLCAQVLRLTGADLSVVVRHDKPAALLEKWGIRAVRYEALERQAADIVVDCTGQEDGFAAALDLVRARGTILLKSTYHGMPRADLTRIAVSEIRVVGSRCGPFPAALRLLEQKLVDVCPMIDARYALDDAPAAIEHASEPGMLKVLLTP
ncbi:MAG TPA: alcohol dehydrogenase catalytic domain-containing protein [Aggregatilinea sp.]|uniref:MDR/zinc-dependent alcohol dehydrogenase-like family protein n=1 Tax=Aggregatilinea sp. TaxID=2806333 RepID=UPI002C9713D6|nr:alcohol dehydrogenase catalytic domain-containing protein [Aggregatilinea sp.]HML20201.1 alcohol dehydrogenase catalytic domain-containing protein [Aggregatilinea sp.]